MFRTPTLTDKISTRTFSDLRSPVGLVFKKSGEPSSTIQSTTVDVLVSSNAQPTEFGQMQGFLVDDVNIYTTFLQLDKLFNDPDSSALLDRIYTSGWAGSDSNNWIQIRYFEAKALWDPATPNIPAGILYTAIVDTYQSPIPR